MKLKALVRGLEIEVKGSKEVEINGISADSKTIAPGNLFFARKGEHVDGASFIPHAMRAGAAAIATDLYDPTCPLPQLILPKVELWEAKLASRFYGNPSKELFVAGVTGTKGKTTSSYLLWHLLNGLGISSGLIGTVDTMVGEEKRASSLTTHFPIQNHKLLREMVAKGCKGVALEVSSHGLDQNRVGEIAFDLALFTNLFPDHLDYHKTMEEYARAKKRIFDLLDQSPKKKKRALVNGDSPWAKFMMEGIKSPIWTFGLGEGVDLRATNLELSSSSVRFEVQGERFEVPLIGQFNVYNALSVIGAGLHLGASLPQIAEILGKFESVPGRLEPVKNNRGIDIFVDYAHNQESLQNVLSTLRELTHKRIICVFGCGGNRDPARRSGMGSVASQLADFTVITSDNPRTEDPRKIIEEIAASFESERKYRVQPDRKEAIKEAIDAARPGDIVLIAGKGHEKVQIFASQTIPFDDVAVAKSFCF